MPRAPRNSPKPPGQPAFEPSDAQRQMVTVLRGAGTAPDAIARLLNISEPTLRKHFNSEMAEGKAEIVARIGAKLIQKALKGDNACMWNYLRTHGGPEWRDKSRVEHTGANGGAIQIEAVRERIEGRILRLAAAGGTIVGPGRADGG